MDHVIFELPRDKKHCPITSFEFYLTKLNTEYDYLWQCPNLFYKYPDKDRWHDKQKVGENSMCKWMKELSISACLSEEYTNHCMRKTCTTALAKSGFAPHEIANVSKYCSLESLKTYIENPTIEEKENYSLALSKYSRKKDLHHKKQQHPLARRPNLCSRKITSSATVKTHRHRTPPLRQHHQYHTASILEEDNKNLLQILVAGENEAANCSCGEVGCIHIQILQTYSKDTPINSQLICNARDTLTSVLEWMKRQGN